MKEIDTKISESNLPFSEAIRHGDTVYVSGQGPLDPATGDVYDGSVTEQTIRTFENVSRILAEAGLTLNDIVKTTVYVKDMAHYEAVNEAYRNQLDEPYPARTAVEVADLPPDIDVEIDVTAAGQ